MKKKKKTIIGLIILIIAVIAFFMIFNFKSKNKLEKTSLRLKWVCQAQFAGYYSALKEGYYKDVGLSVTIDPAGPNISPIQAVTSGVNEFGIAGAEQIITAIDNKVPIVAIAVIYRETPEALVSKKELNIKAPKDLEGKTVGVVYENDENLYRLFLKKNNVDENSIKEVPAITGISQVMTDQVDAKMAYEMNDAILLELEGEKVNLLRFRDYGVKVYADTIFTTKEMVEKHPDKVKKFLKASLKGWNYAIENSEKSVSQLLEINPTLKHEHQLGYLTGSIPLIMTDEKIGVSDSKIWENMIDNLYENKMIKKKIKASEVYTNEFLK